MPIVPRNLHSKYELNTAKDKGISEVSLWLPWQPNYHSNEVRGDVYRPNKNLIRLKANVLQSEMYFPIILII